ncbi:patatin-like phospholipase family protein [Sphingobium sufflavum]|uniref:patatin-like phospholipase family protein n=1 Tax=Sphingobium sufflavum TaxID=1129547 RepID=UPI001F201F87|nr:patatin-like phospholipase family protein [Sphingobium sufflavum]MCE7796374.1 patatin-like phospholipase family protein [Sphingobium sufflavum]
MATSALMLVSACQTPHSIRCDPRKVVAYRLDVPTPVSDGYRSGAAGAQGGAPGEPGQAPSEQAPSEQDRPAQARLSDVIRDAVRIAANRAAPGTRTPASLLMMSGGSQNGAFSAGLLDEWRHRSVAGKLPDFAVVTGVSTGSLLATFAFTGRTEGLIDAYSPRDERDVLTPLARGNSIGAYVNLVRKGARGDLSPLRGKLDRLLTPEILTAVADRYDDGARMVVGVVDIDDGNAYAYDLSQVAAHWRDAWVAEGGAGAAPVSSGVSPGPKPGPGASAAELKACYVELLVASSSAPLSARPVFINDHMLVDGGARFGMFFVAADEALKPATVEAVPTPVPPAQTYLIVNGTLEIAKECPRAEAADGHCPASGAHKKWNLLELGIRTSDLLQNQGYRYSADYIERRNAEVVPEGGMTPLPFRFARIEPDLWTHEASIQRLDNGAVEKHSCREWQKRDIDPKAYGLPGKPPVQFQKYYMRCLIDYGRARARLLGRTSDQAPDGKWYDAR